MLAHLQASPDDVAVDGASRLWVTAREAGLITELSASGSTITVLHDASGPEGVAALADGRLLVAEQGANRIAIFDPGDTSPRPWLPVTNTTANPGVDGIAYDVTSVRLLIPDSANGRLLTVALATAAPRVVANGLGRPVSAVAAPDGALYVAAESSPGLVRITPTGTRQALGSSTNLDEVLYLNGLLYVADLAGHAVTAVDPSTGHAAVLVRGIDAPQGLTATLAGQLVVVDSTAHLVSQLPACR